MEFNLYDIQRESILEMINVNADATTGLKTPKFIILDESSKDILYQTISQEDLSEANVIGFGFIDEARTPQTSADGIYFVRPNSYNMEFILADVSIPLYGSSLVNFLSFLPTRLRDDYPHMILNKDFVLYDRYLDFWALDNNHFTLSSEDSYVELLDPSNNAELLDPSNEDYCPLKAVGVKKIVIGLFCVCKTLGIVPVIRCPPGGVAETVAVGLDKKIRDFLISEGRDFGTSSEVPVLCLFDRNFDLGVAVQHDFRYSTLVHDLLDFDLRTLRGTGETEGFRLDFGDPLWASYKGLEFTELAILIEEQLKPLDFARRCLEVAESTRLFGPVLRGDVSGLVRLNNAVTYMKELVSRAPTIEKHTKIATQLLHEIRARSIDWYAKREYDMMIKGSIDQNEIKSVLNGKGTKTDKLRFAIMYLICLENIPQREIEIVEAALREAGVDTSAFQYVKETKSLNQSFASPSSASRDNVVDCAEKLAGLSVSPATAGVHNLSSNDRQQALGRTVEALMEGRPNPEIETYMLFDPRSPESSSGSHTREPFQKAIVFMIGGGNYGEYENLQLVAKRHQPRKRIIYGTTEFLSGSMFVEQLARLGKEMYVPPMFLQ